MGSYDSVPHADAPVPYKIIEEANNHLIEEPSKEHDAFIASLPLEPVIEPSFTFDQPRRLYKGVWTSEVILRGILVMQQHLETRPTDIFLASFVKSGTTWLKAMIFATLTRTKYSLDQHPLHTHNPHQCVTYMDLGFAIGRGQVIEAIPSPRVMSTHMPYSLLPDSITKSNCRIVYVWRDPKDVLVSLWYFVQKIMGGADKIATFDQFYEKFYQGLNSYGPVWDHVLGYWEESKRRPEKILFLKYEHILQEPVKCANHLAHFLGFPYSEAEENQGVVNHIVELCSIKTLKNLDVNKDGNRATPTANVHISYASYFRKGEAGDWKSHMTREKAERLDTMIKEKFKGSGLQL